MIAYLTGQPLTQANRVIMLVQGVGYGVLTSPKVLSQIAGQEVVSLYIYTHVREDQLTLYGFLTYQEQQLFELLLSVSGVGPSTALHLINTNPDQLVAAVQEAKVSFFTAVPRVGKKLAQKIIIELGGKLGELKELNLTPLSPKEQTIVAALTSLGFDEQRVRDVVATIDINELDETQAIKHALAQVGQS